MVGSQLKSNLLKPQLTYANAFDHEFSLHLRERRLVTLLNMQEAALEVESNILASNRLKENPNHQIYDRKGKNEVISPASTSQTTDRKIHEMDKLVKILKENLNKLELEKNSNNPAQEGERSPNQFRSQLAPIFIPRERRNDDIQRESREN